MFLCPISAFFFKRALARKSMLRKQWRNLLTGYGEKAAIDPRRDQCVRQSLSLKLELTGLARVASQQVPGIPMRLCTGIPSTHNHIQDEVLAESISVRSSWRSVSLLASEPSQVFTCHFKTEVDNGLYVMGILLQGVNEVTWGPIQNSFTICY